MSTRADLTAFTGFPPDALEFYVGLEADNSKAYWLDHKDTYDRAVRAPMLDLLDALEEEFGPAKLFRPYRDVRFSADKSPYKTHQGALVGSEKAVGYYVQVSATGLVAGGGFHSHGADQTARFRAAVDARASGAELEKVLDALSRKGFEQRGDAVKTTPRGYPAEHPRIGTLRLKEVMLTRDLGAPDWLGTKRALTEVRRVWRDVRPLVEWVGTYADAPESAGPARRR
jgi:uncharacterized protein (TIGR02453 family)